MPAVNGQPVTDTPPDPRLEIARAVQAATAEDLDPPWDALTDDERAGELWIAEHYIAAHLSWLTTHGFKVIPPGATPVPKTDAEAMAMVRASKAYFDAQKRRGKLMASAAPKKLILPKGMH